MFFVHGVTTLTGSHQQKKSWKGLNQEDRTLGSEEERNRGRQGTLIGLAVGLILQCSSGLKISE